MLDQNRIPKGALICNCCKTASKRFSENKVQTKMQKIKERNINIHDQNLSHLDTANEFLTSEIDINSVKKQEIDAEHESSADESLVVDIPRTTASHKYCFVFILKKWEKKKYLITSSAIVETFVEKKILIPRRSKSCPEHLTESGSLKTDVLSKLRIAKSESKLKAEDIKLLLEDFRINAQKNNLFKRFFNRFLKELLNKN